MIFIFLLCCCFLFITPVNGQSTVAKSFKNDNSLKYGFAYFGHYKLNSNWGIHSDIQFRMDENLKFMFQDVFRVGMIRYLGPNYGLGGGYVLLNTYSETFEDYFSEHRLWEQLTYYRKENRRTLIFRSRIEQRYVEKLKFSPAKEAETETYKYGNRIRFFNRTGYDLTKKPDAENIIYLAIQDEVFLNVAAPALNRNFFDQNRFLLVVGLNKNNHTRIEAGYVNVILNPYRSHNIVIHSLHFAVIQTLNFQPAE